MTVEKCDAAKGIGMNIGVLVCLQKVRLTADEHKEVIFMHHVYNKYILARTLYMPSK